MVRIKPGSYQVGTQYADYFTEFEYAALQEETKPYVRSELCLQHLRDLHLDTTQSLIFSQAAESAIASLCQQHCVDVSFVRSMSKLRQAICSNRICTTRRLELELMHRGKVGRFAAQDDPSLSQLTSLSTNADVLEFQVRWVHPTSAEPDRRTPDTQRCKLPTTKVLPETRHPFDCLIDASS